MAKILFFNPTPVLRLKSADLSWKTRIQASVQIRKLPEWLIRVMRIGIALAVSGFQAGENQQVQSAGRGSDMRAVLFLSYTTKPCKNKQFYRIFMIKYFKILVWARIRCDLHCVNSVHRNSVTSQNNEWHTTDDVTSCRACQWRHSYDVTPRYCIVMTSWNSGPNFGALETAQQSKGIPEGDPPGQSGISIVGSFLSHGRTDLLGGRFSFVYFSRISRI
jgi:hypothetical protein